MVVRVGDRGTTASPLQPQGVIELEGRRFDARSEYGVIPVGTPVCVVGGDHMSLIVRPADVTGFELADLGRVINTSYSDRIESAAKEVAAERDRDLAEHHRWGALTTAVTATVVTILAVWLRWAWIGEQYERPRTTALAFVLGSFGLGALAHIAIDYLLCAIDRHFRYVSWVSTNMGVGVAITVLAAAVPGIGWANGGLAALALGAIAAAVAPLALMLIGTDS